jgi:hypothetical protein
MNAATTSHGNLESDFDISLSPDGTYALLTNHRDVNFERALECQRAMDAFATEHNIR